MIVWRQDRAARVILPTAEALALKDLLDGGAPLTIKLSREPRRADVADPAANARKYAAVCEAVLTDLVVLDVTSAAVEVRVAPEFPPDEAEVQQAAEEAAAALEGKGAAKGSKGGADKGKAAGKSDKVGKGGKGQQVHELPVEDPELPHPFDAAGTTLAVRVFTDKPLYKRPRPPPPPVPRPSDLIPKRILPSLLPKKAEAEFEAQVKAAAHSLLADFSTAFGDAPLGGPGDDDDADPADPAAVAAAAATAAADREARRRAFLYELNNSGGYYALKEKLKKSVVRIVRETFHKTDEAMIPDGGDRDRLLSDLYVHLTKLAHRSLHGFFYPEPGPEAGTHAARAASGAAKAVGGATEVAGGGPGGFRAPTVPTSEPRLVQLRRLADEMEVAQRWDAAAALHEERLVLAENDAAVWLDYALLLLRAGRGAKAEAALREAISIAPENESALTAYGCLLCARGKEAEAESFLKGAADVSPHSPIAWALVASLYTLQGRDYDAKRAFKHAASLADRPESLRLDLAERLLPLCAETMVETVLQLQLAADRKADENAPESARARACRAKARLLAHRYAEAEADLQALVAELPTRADLAADLGHSRYFQGKHDAALQAYAAARDRAPHARDSTVLLRMAQLSARAAEAALAGPVQQALWSRARDAALRACKLSPTSSSWLCVGVSCMALSALGEAEEALSEACVLNNRNEAVWAWLCVLTLRLGRVDEANESLKQALRLGLDDPALLTRLGGDYLARGDWPAAEDLLRRASAAGAGAKAARLLADCLAERGRVGDAAEIYEGLLEGHAAAAAQGQGAAGGDEAQAEAAPLPESEERHIRERLARIYAATGRA